MLVFKLFQYFHYLDAIQGGFYDSSGKLFCDFVSESRSPSGNRAAALSPVIAVTRGCLSPT
jgi:hypothetical protein